MKNKKVKTILCLAGGIIGVVSLICVASAAGQKNPLSSSSGVRNTSSISCRNERQGQNDAILKDSETILPDYAYNGSDPEERLIYQANAQWMAKGTRQGFSIMAAKILGSYKQGSKLKLFARIEDSEYSLYGNKLSYLSGSSMPVAVTFAQSTNGTYQMEKFEVPKDGTFFSPSIRKFCTQPVTGDVIQGLADKLIASDSYGQELEQLEYQHLAYHLHKNGISDAVLLDSYNKATFSLRDYYK